MDRPVTIATGQVNPADMRAPRIEQRRELLRGGEDEIGRTCPKATPGECGGPCRVRLVRDDQIDPAFLERRGRGGDHRPGIRRPREAVGDRTCLLYTSDA